MKRGALILFVAFSSGLLIISSAMASDLSGQRESQQSMTTQTGEQVPQQVANLQLNEEQRKELQRLLNEQGYEVANIDGVIGQDTMAAIRRFQESAGLKTTGMPNQETLRALAPSSDQQEFFGLSPEFGETGEKTLNVPQMPETKSY